jgi:hypothetical protein
MEDQGYQILIDLGISLGKELLGSLTKAKAPQDVLDAAGAAVTALVAHKNDLITKANLEAQRG